jgi:purine-nucleoside phosphorylase
MAATGDDLALLKQRMALPQRRGLYLSKVHYDEKSPDDACLVGPVLGAPYAVMLLETLKVWGIQRIIFIGWCGAIEKTVAIGDIILARGALVDEGTSLHYNRKSGAHVSADATLTDLIRKTLIDRKLPFRQDTVWTTDGVFRETPAKVAHFRGQGAVAVEMEFSALLSAAAFHGLALGGVLTVSDELSTGTWRPGFKSPEFLTARALLADAVTDLVHRI